VYRSDLSTPSFCGPVFSPSLPVVDPEESIPADVQWIKAEVVWMDGADSDVKLCPSWVGWQPVNMKKEPDGVWSVITRCPVGERAFLFIVDGEWKVSSRHAVAQDATGAKVNTRVFKAPTKPVEPEDEEESKPIAEEEEKKGLLACMC